jgi:hypothetical protein
VDDIVIVIVIVRESVMVYDGVSVIVCVIVGDVVKRPMFTVCVGVAVRVGVPVHEGVGDVVKSPAFTVGVGLKVYVDVCV